jgi:hypothetical protein
MVNLFLQESILKESLFLLASDQGTRLFLRMHTIQWDRQ